LEYLIAKWLHILFSTFLFGTGVGSAFYLFFSTLQRNTTVVAGVAQLVVRADWLFTATTVVLQPLSGIYLVHLLGHPLSARWLQWSIVLYVIAIGCWLPVVWLQIRMRNSAQAAARLGEPLPREFWRCFYLWVALGIPALIAFLIIFWLMVARPL
jgi:uncharacterized membrane protein